MPSIPSAPIYDVASLLPHSGHMVLIDCVKEFGDDYTVCRAPVGDKHILSAGWCVAVYGLYGIDGAGHRRFREALRL